MSGSVRYCNRCLLVKPDRAHHCSICSRCVLKMDHHCPWVNNCVCFQNYKFFVLFLGYALLYCLFIMSTCLPYFIKFWMGEMGTSGSPGRYHIVFAFFVALMFAISLGSLFGYHCYLVAHNRTTLEMLVFSRRMWSPKGFSIVKKAVDDVLNTRPKNKPTDFSVIKTMIIEGFRAPTFRGGADKNGFSIGALSNFREVFGKQPSLWALPVFTSAGNGCEYPVRREHQLQTFVAAADARYESMGTTRSSFGDGIAFPLPKEDEDTESLLSSDRWERWGEMSRPFDEVDGSSIDEI